MLKLRGRSCAAAVVHRANVLFCYGLICPRVDRHEPLGVGIDDVADVRRGAEASVIVSAALVGRREERSVVIANIDRQENEELGYRDLDERMHTSIERFDCLRLGSQEGVRFPQVRNKSR